MAIAAILVDTNVVSFIMKDAPEGRLYHAHLSDMLTLDVQVSIILNPAARAYRIPWIFSA